MHAADRTCAPPMSTFRTWSLRNERPGGPPTWRARGSEEGSPGASALVRRAGRRAKWKE
ncbi:hypothetical protein C2E23DRAFT_825120 [Lenzites betulinus]|nr:hypothetical protein C2E23DRAFT_825120 [Lenzites betulinus]